jgi:hypothetical protein
MDEEKKLSSEEQRERMKEEYKRELKARKEFLGKVDALKKQQTLLNAMEGMQYEDDSDEWINKLNQETAMREAKAEMALESTGEDIPVEIAPPELSDEELKKIAAAEAVRKMKEQMAAEAAGSGNVEGPALDPNSSEGGERPSRKMLDGLL